MLSDEIGGNNGAEASGSNNYFAPGQPGASMQTQQASGAFGLLGPNDNNSLDPPGSDGSRYYTIQRVNGNGGNGKGDGTAGPHKHTLQESDRVKKNSIARHFLKVEKVRKKTQVSVSLRAASVFVICKRGFQPTTRTATDAACRTTPSSLSEDQDITWYFVAVLRNCNAFRQTQSVIFVDLISL